jgi:hypothetical protein
MTTLKGSSTGAYQLIMTSEQLKHRAKQMVDAQVFHKNLNWLAAICAPVGILAQKSLFL